MCSGSEAGSNLRLIDVVFHSALGSRAMKRKKKFRVHTYLKLALRLNILISNSKQQVDDFVGELTF